MAACHFRSISLPARSHPLTVTTEEELYKLKASESSSIGHKLSGLKNLFESVNDLLQLRLAHQTLSHDRQSQCAENALNGSLELLDLCESTRDFFSRMKESKGKINASGWSVISKLLQSKRVSCEVENGVNEAEKIDAELITLKSSKDICLSQLQNLLKGLEAFESSIQEAEEELECIYRQLVKTRVSLLNILNH
ncbi:hypothetical protein GH714_032541 [Hevea brasiliensis]|uniref:DUF241 domain-containing protein n=1 Tax=Hevea brasiliensis TaxID=3981 RepID=A0A6A6L4U5_HEVBR|nr:hypothetical protein GH714_032541 [Hevea brasiliensis]